MNSLPGKYLVALILWLSALDFGEPIMVTFGTSKGPIIPRQIDFSKSLQPRNIAPRSPAPVNEYQEDIPNPNFYKPLVPHQYRTKLYSVQPNPNLLLGTPLDQRYTPSLQKYDFLRKQYSRSLTPDYTGPHIFDVQDYELYDLKKTTLQPSRKYTEQELEHRVKPDQKSKFVPEIGVVYSAGLRYYVPQVVYFDQKGGGEDENSVYDKNDDKYLIYSGQH
ncbi:GV1 [Rhynchophorus ferrugineus]|uniref:GV1 n=1 Tax=Rhynchophorus ferrugineus TaxID=354439 RepID=UPI003FCD86A6